MNYNTSKTNINHDTSQSGEINWQMDGTWSYRLFLRLVKCTPNISHCKSYCYAKYPQQTFQKGSVSLSDKMGLRSTFFGSRALCVIRHCCTTSYSLYSAINYVHRGKNKTLKTVRQPKQPHIETSGKWTRYVASFCCAYGMGAFP